jgi:hypothetical protein
MNLTNIVETAIRDTFLVHTLREGVLVQTQCLYQGGGIVRVLVRGGEGTFYVSDEGYGVGEIEAAGANVDDADKLLRHLLKPLGLSSAGGVIKAPPCSAKALGYAIASVANASTLVADWLFAHMKVKPPVNFKDSITRLLQMTFPATVHSGKLTGGSNKEYTFEHIVFLPNNRKMIVDPVVHDMKSISSRVLANIDVRRANHGNVEQRIVYNDADEWSAEDLNLLTLGAISIPFSRAQEVLPRIAHAN